MDIKSTHFPKIGWGILIGLGLIIYSLLVFQIGLFTGYQKASFSFRSGDNYYRAFNPRKNNLMKDLPRQDFPGGHGVTGKIISINLPTFMVAGTDNLEKIINISDDTVIRSVRKNLTANDLKINDLVVIIGAPDQTGLISAKLIRIMPPPLEMPPDQLNKQ